MENMNKIFAKYFKPAKQNDALCNAELCKNCGGMCCYSMGCHISPLDLKEISFEAIVNLINESDCVSLDWWDGDPVTEAHDGTRRYYLRIKNIGAKVIDPSYGGVCTILTDNGCPLSFEYRPRGARELVPNEYNGCIVGYSKRQCAIDWSPFNDILDVVYDYYVIQGEVTQKMDWSLLDNILGLGGEQ